MYHLHTQTRLIHIEVVSTYNILLLLWIYPYLHPHHNKGGGFGLLMTCSKSPLYHFQYSSSERHHPDMPEKRFSSADTSKDLPNCLHQLFPPSKVVSFYSGFFSSYSQPMRTEQLLETAYQVNSVVSLGWETSVWISFLLTAPPDFPMCFFSKPTSWNHHIL